MSQPERWLPIADWEGLYEVSDLGRVRGVDRFVGDRYRRLQRGRVVRFAPDKDGYHMVFLYRDGRPHARKVHRLVLQAFVGPADGRCALHRNDIRNDNRLSNLYWGDALRNHLDSVARGTFKFGSAHANSKLTESAVRDLRALRKTGASWNFLARRFGVTTRAIRYAARGQTWRHVK